MRAAICTISTKGHLFKTKALFHSLSGMTDAKFHCLVTDVGNESVLESEIQQVLLSELKDGPATSIKAKYSGDKLRWACKPLLLLHLLNNGYDRVIYVDNDIYFYSSPVFLFDSLNEHSVILTPHNYLASAEERQYWLEATYRIGLYNAGFIGVNQHGKESMQWWAKCCAYNVKKSSWRGLFDDQRYLDLMPVLFDHVHVEKHPGCNVAGWNTDRCQRSLNKDGEVVLNDRWPLVFVHYNGFTMRAILNGSDELLRTHLDSYFQILKKFDPSFSPKRITSYGSMDGVNFLRHICWHIARYFDRITV